MCAALCSGPVSSHGQRLAPSKKNCSGAPWLESNGFWLWGFKRQNFLSWVWLAGHTFSLHRITNWWFLAMMLQGLDFSIQSKVPGHIFSLYEIYSNWWWVLILRLQGPDFFILSVAPRTYVFLLQTLSELAISGSEGSRAKFSYFQRGPQDIHFLYTRRI